ncbi:hypothetical protein, partial [Pseudomonas viridiflava]|uniref:hypothetical protein n=1 Tax=Pseudomonas viridiflava TaxID=33069 RepID=UPI0019D00DE2
SPCWCCACLRSGGIDARKAASYQTTRNLLNEHAFVGGGLPAMHSTRYFRKIASSFIAGKPPLIKLPVTY